MAQTSKDRRFPRGALFGAGALVGLSLLATGFARVTGIGTSQAPTANVVQSRELRFEDRSDGGVAVYEAETGRMVDVLAPGTNGFVRGVLRGLARERRSEKVGSAPPFVLTRWSDGRLSIEDAATHERIELIAFGQTNFAAFARLLNDRSASR
ncbi:MAG: photosynthetic complex assembly protein PuhC [Xanthobacteraceae bacterium]|jgi:putative photosynthetic complex assembly protein